MHLSKWTALFAAASQAYAMPLDGSKASEAQESTTADVSPLILASAEHELVKRDLFAASDICVSRRTSSTAQFRHADNTTESLHINLHVVPWHPGLCVWPKHAGH